LRLSKVVERGGGTPPFAAWFDYALLDDPDFKEDAVREEIVHPLLLRLGYSSSGANKIIRSKTLAHPFLTIGSKKRPINTTPDYLLSVDSVYRWVLDAKAPGEAIASGKNVEQAYSYAIHPEIRARLFALCNGRRFTLFDIESQSPLMDFPMQELEKNWQGLCDFLAPDAFRHLAEAPQLQLAPPQFDYIGARPPAEVTKFKKQSAKRHHGVHGYFTRQVWSVVQKYIQTFSSPGDLVLDPFGGSGVTYIEALILGRNAIHLDTNPLSKFIVETIVSGVDFGTLTDDFERVISEFSKRRPRKTGDVEAILKKYPYPKNVQLPADSDVRTVEELFSREQLAELALLKGLIVQVKDASSRVHLLLMFSGLLNKINLTYHASEGRSEGRGDSAIFRYYRYRIAHDSPRLDVVKVMRSRFKKVVAAKQELRPFLSKADLRRSKVLKGSATSLKGIQADSIDYIYTDPPYGSKIPYLDLSTMWNAWLDLEVTDDDFADEAIEGGELKKTKGDYSGLIAKSIKEMYRVLKFNRWMSFVFAHKDPAYWHLIVEAAEKAGFEYAGVVKQNNGQTSFKKRQNPFTVLSGQLIINFRKVPNPKSLLAAKLGMDIADIIQETIEGTIAANQGATVEEINDGLVIRGLELGFLHVLSQQYQDLTPLLRERFQYEPLDQKYYIKKNSKFKTHVDVRLRVRYYLLSYMRGMEHKGIHPSFDDIVLSVMPLLKNGITPPKQTVLSVLESLADRDSRGRWRLKKDQGELPV
jgi:16S rRNA G966 N2-methylase RsmD